jgi:hypothetical protein
MEDRRQLEMQLPGRRRKEFVVGIDTAPIPRHAAAGHPLFDWFHIAMKIQPTQQIADERRKPATDAQSTV